MRKIFFKYNLNIQKKYNYILQNEIFNDTYIYYSLPTSIEFINKYNGIGYTDNSSKSIITLYQANI